VTDELGRVSLYTFNENGNPTGFVDPMGNSYSLEWDDNFNRTAKVDENGNFTRYEYDTNGNLVGLINAAGDERRYTYTVDFNQIASIIDFDGSTQTFEYDTSGNLIRLTNTTGSSFSMEYDERGLMVALIDHNGHRTDLQYGPTGEPSRIEDDSGVLLMAYDLAGNLVSRTTPDGGVTTYTYDGLNRLVSKTDALGGTIAHSYDALGNRVSTTDPRGNTTTFQYDERNRLIAVTDPTGLVTRRAYDLAGNLVSITDANGNVTAYEYNLANRKIREVRPGGAVREMTYDAVGNLTSLTAPDGIVMTYFYDELNRLTSKTAPSGDRERYSYDALGNRTLIERVDDQGNVFYRKAYDYDSESRIVSITEGSGSTMSFVYNALDEVISRIDPNGGVTQQTYNPYGQILSMRDAANGDSVFSYDVAGNVVAVTNPNGNTTAYDYDLLGRKIRETSPDTGVTELRYDESGNLISVTDARGITRGVEYTERDEPAKVYFPDAAETQTFNYDTSVNGLGRISGFEDESGSTNYEYDGRGNRTAVSKTIGVVGYRVEMQYDLADRITEITYPSGAELNLDFDADGRVSAIRYDGQTILSSVTYLPFGPAHSWTFGSGAIRDADFDDRYALRGVNTSGVHDLVLTLDPFGQPTQIEERLGSTTQSFTYDALQRLIAATGPFGNLSYDYDAVGNRLNELDTGGLTNYTYEAGTSHLTGISRGTTETLNYDAIGNLVSDGRFQYEYNDANRLSVVRVGPDIVATYKYDAEGRRVSKAVGGTLTHFIYGHKGELLGEYDGATGEPLREYVYLGNIPVGFVQSGALYFVHTDHLGTPRSVTNIFGVKVWKWVSGPFGDAYADGDPDGDGVSIVFGLRFAGQYFDAETGRHYNYLRDYDPRWGRYIQSDPIGLRGGFNTYVYAGNNPLLFLDPTGEEITGEWIESPTLSPSWPDAPRFSGFTLNWSWWGYLKLVKVFLKVNGRISAAVECTDEDECAEEERSWTISATFPVWVSGIVELGPNLYAIGLGIITGNIWVSIGANVFLAAGATATAVARLEAEYGDIARTAVQLIRQHGPTVICNSGWPPLNLSINIGNL